MDFRRKKAKKDAKICESAIRLQENHSFLESPIDPLHQSSATWLVSPHFFRFFAPFCGGKSSEIFNAFALQ